MSHPKVSYRRAKAISSAILLVILAGLVFTDQWWPGLLLAIGLPLAVRHYLLGRTYDMCLTLVVFVGGFIAAAFNIPWEILTPVLLVLAAIYLLAREFLDPEVSTEAEDEESLNREIDETLHK